MRWRRSSPLVPLAVFTDLPVPTVDIKMLLKLLQQLDLEAHPPGAPVAEVRLRTEPTLPQPN
jgi:hypothetical protein